jgi:hypothetical protein
VVTSSGSATSIPVFQVASQTWQAAQGFSTAVNPAGVWSYGWEPSLGRAFARFTTESDCATGLPCWNNALVYPNLAMVGKNITTGSLLYISVVVPTNVVWLGAQANAAVTRWTAPVTGVYTITGAFQAISLDLPTVNVGIFRNGTTSLFFDSFTSFGQEKSFTLSALPLAAGTTIDFAAAYTDDAGSDNIGLTATISLLQ